MHKFFIPSADISSECVNIKDPELIHYLTNVLRIKVCEEIVLFDEKGNQYLSSVKNVSNKGIELTIKSKRKLALQKTYSLTVACAIPKKAKFDDIVDKITQLGADKIIPVISERVIVKLDKVKAISRLERWKKIALSATQQSQRVNLPVIEDAQDVGNIISQSGGYDLKLIGALIDERKPIKEVLDRHPDARNILVLIGPEGDFTPKEVSLAKKQRFIPISLGDLVLRVDTAAIAVTSLIKLYK